MKKYTTLLILSLLIGLVSNAQQDFLMYNMYDIPQSAYSNPSNQFNGKFYIGLPALSSNYLSFSNSGFAYSDAIKKQGDSLLLNFNSLIAELEDENFTSLNTKIDLFSFGIQLSKKTQLTLNATQNFNFRFNYTKDFIRFIHGGNGAFEDNTANFENIGLSMNSYTEYGLGISHQFNNKLRLGMRAKYLYGIANIYSKKTDISLTTDPVSFALTAKADIDIQTAGLEDGDDGDISDNIFSGRDNTGYGIDLGGHYEINKKLSINASILDLGFIDWNYNTKSYQVDNGNYTYSGIAFDAFSEDGDTSSETSFDRVLDSLEEAFELKEPTDGYRSPLTARFYIGANYKLGEKNVFGGLLQTEVFQGNVRPSFTLSANRKMTKWITLAASYTIINRSFNNLGFGFNINPGPVQIYVMSDNLLGLMQPQHARHMQVRFGINLIFGSTKTKEMHPSLDGIKAAGKHKDKKEEKKEKEVIPKAEEPVKEADSSATNETDSIQKVAEPIETDSTSSNDSIPQPSIELPDSLNNEPIPTDSTSATDSIQGLNIPIETDSINSPDSGIFVPINFYTPTPDSLNNTPSLDSLNNGEGPIIPDSIATPALIEKPTIEEPVGAEPVIEDPERNNSDTAEPTEVEIAPVLDEGDKKEIPEPTDSTGVNP